MGNGKMAIALGTFYLMLVAASLGAVSDEYAFQTSDFMRTTQYRAPDALDLASTDGAYSAPNIAWDRNGRIGTDWFIDEQHWADDVVCAGIAQNDINAIQRGLLMFAWGFAQQQPNGSFLCTDQFHATAFFVEGVAHASLMLEKSPFARTYAQPIKTLKGQVLKSARWMNEPGCRRCRRCH